IPIGCEANPVGSDPPVKADEFAERAVQHSIFSQTSPKNSSCCRLDDIEHFPIRREIETVCKFQSIGQQLGLSAFGDSRQSATTSTPPCVSGISEINQPIGSQCNFIGTSKQLTIFIRVAKQRKLPVGGSPEHRSQVDVSN